LNPFKVDQIMLTAFFCISVPLPLYPFGIRTSSTTTFAIDCVAVGLRQSASILTILGDLAFAAFNIGCASSSHLLYGLKVGSFVVIFFRVPVQFGGIDQESKLGLLIRLRSGPPAGEIRLHRTQSCFQVRCERSCRAWLFVD
jgi:hypothetical protein